MNNESKRNETAPRQGWRELLKGQSIDSHILRCVIIVSILNVAALINTQLAIKDIKQLEAKIVVLSQKLNAALSKIDASDDQSKWRNNALDK